MVFRSASVVVNVLLLARPGSLFPSLIFVNLFNVFEFFIPPVHRGCSPKHCTAKILKKHEIRGPAIF